MAEGGQSERESSSAPWRLPLAELSYPLAALTHHNARHLDDDDARDAEDWRLALTARLLSDQKAYRNLAARAKRAETLAAACLHRWRRLDERSSLQRLVDWRERASWRRRDDADARACSAHRRSDALRAWARHVRDERRRRRPDASRWDQLARRCAVRRTARALDLVRSATIAAGALRKRERAAGSMWRSALLREALIRAVSHAAERRGKLALLRIAEARRSALERRRCAAAIESLLQAASVVHSHRARLRVACACGTRFMAAAGFAGLRANAAHAARVALLRGAVQDRMRRECVRGFCLDASRARESEALLARADTLHRRNGALAVMALLRAAAAGERSAMAVNRLARPRALEARLRTQRGHLRSWRHRAALRRYSKPSGWVLSALKATFRQWTRGHRRAALGLRRYLALVLNINMSQARRALTAWEACSDAALCLDAKRTLAAHRYARYEAGSAWHAVRRAASENTMRMTSAQRGRVSNLARALNAWWGFSHWRGRMVRHSRRHALGAALSKWTRSHCARCHLKTGAEAAVHRRRVAGLGAWRRSAAVRKFARADPFGRGAQLAELGARVSLRVARYAVASAVGRWRSLTRRHISGPRHARQQRIRRAWRQWQAEILLRLCYLQQVRVSEKRAQSAAWALFKAWQGSRARSRSLDVRVVAVHGERRARGLAEWRDAARCSRQFCTLARLHLGRSRRAIIRYRVAAASRRSRALAAAQNETLAQLFAQSVGWALWCSAYQVAAVLRGLSKTSAAAWRQLRAKRCLEAQDAWRAAASSTKRRRALVAASQARIEAAHFQLAIATSQATRRLRSGPGVASALAVWIAFRHATVLRETAVVAIHSRQLRAPLLTWCQNAAMQQAAEDLLAEALAAAALLHSVAACRTALKRWLAAHIDATQASASSATCWRLAQASPESLMVASGWRLWSRRLALAASPEVRIIRGRWRVRVARAERLRAEAIALRRERTVAHLLHAWRCESRSRWMRRAAASWLQALRSQRARAHAMLRWSLHAQLSHDTDADGMLAQRALAREAHRLIVRWGRNVETERLLALRECSHKLILSRRVWREWLAWQQNAPVANARLRGVARGHARRAQLLRGWKLLFSYGHTLRIAKALGTVVSLRVALRVLLRWSAHAQSARRRRSLSLSLRSRLAGIRLVASLRHAADAVPLARAREDLAVARRRRAALRAALRACADRGHWRALARRADSFACSSLSPLVELARWQMRARMARVAEARDAIAAAHNARVAKVAALEALTRTRLFALQVSSGEKRLLHSRLGRWSHFAGQARRVRHGPLRSGWARLAGAVCESALWRASERDEVQALLQRTLEWSYRRWIDASHECARASDARAAAARHWSLAAPRWAVRRMATLLSLPSSKSIEALCHHRRTSKLRRALYAWRLRVNLSRWPPHMARRRRLAATLEAVGRTAQRCALAQRYAAASRRHAAARALTLALARLVRHQNGSRRISASTLAVQATCRRSCFIRALESLAHAAVEGGAAAHLAALARNTDAACRLKRALGGWLEAAARETLLVRASAVVAAISGHRFRRSAILEAWAHWNRHVGAIRDTLGRLATLLHRLSLQHGRRIFRRWRDEAAREGLARHAARFRGAERLAEAWQRWAVVTLTITFS